MSVLSDNYKRIMAEIEERITDPEELEFVKQKFLEVSTLFMEIIDNLSEKTDSKITELEKKQEKIEKRISEVQGAIDELENDFYDETEIEDELPFDFEIVCPYCNHEFVAEISGKNEVQCPECRNIIELDWNDEEEQEYNTEIGCMGGCKSCGGCADNEEEDDDDEEDM